MRAILAFEGQANIFRVLFLIADRDEVYSAELKREGFTPRTYYRVLEKLLAMGLIKSRLDDSAEGGFRRMYSLTPQGREVNDHLVEIEKILVSLKRTTHNN